MEKLNWRHFRILHSIRVLGSVTAAARALGLTQSAATHQVKEAERRLGVALLARRGRQIVLTQAGDVLADAAQASAPLLAAAEVKAQEDGLGDAPRLRMAFGAQDGLAWVAPLYAHLRDRGQPLRLDLVSAGAGEPAELLRRNEADLALSLGDAAFPDLWRDHLVADELVAIFAPDHPLAARRRIHATDITGETYFAHALTPQRGFEFDRFFRPAKSTPRHIARVESLAAILDLVARGHGISIQPRSAVAHLARSSSARGGALRLRPLGPQPVMLSWHLHATAAIQAAHGLALLGDLAGQLRRAL